ncbi:hypothetical protein H2200_005482 [Cladophialophora chaetospira]|uniref:Uncharacterized protein n=1 Tax=Cladophialophora chaetospira TaxID=386627 RepID=A0AA38XC25_9EURO|nr:hypothetical protein H2200_005482 [Cladophialophora chaetospira]
MPDEPGLVWAETILPSIIELGTFGGSITFAVVVAENRPPDRFEDSLQTFLALGWFFFLITLGWATAARQALAFQRQNINEAFADYDRWLKNGVRKPNERWGPKPTFLTLPAELRSIIYHHYFAISEITVRYREPEGEYSGYESEYDGLEDLEADHVSNTPRPYAILRVCKQIHLEAMAIAVSLPVSYVFPHAGGHYLPDLPKILQKQVTLVSITSRGIPCPTNFTTKLVHGRSYGFHNVREVLIHSFASFPIKIIDPRCNLKKICASGVETDLNGSLKPRFRLTRQIIWKDVEIKDIKKCLGNFTLRMRCSLYQPHISEIEDIHFSDLDVPDDGRIWTCEYSGILSWNKQDMKLTDLRRHKPVSKMEKNLFKGVKEEDENDKFGPYGWDDFGYHDYYYDKDHRRKRLGKWLKWQSRWQD